MSQYIWPSIEQQTEWAVRIRNDDESVWSEIHDRLAMPISKIICSKYFGVLPEDVAADTMLRLWEYRGLYDPKFGSLRSFLFTVAYHVAVDMIREMGLDRPVEGEFLERLVKPLPPGEPSAEVYRLAKFLEVLSARDRDIVMASASAHGDDYAGDLARRYEISRDHVRVIAARVRARLKRLMEEDGQSHDPEDTVSFGEEFDHYERQ